MPSFTLKTLASLSLLAIPAMADMNERMYSGFSKRQEFIPTTTTGQGSTCADAFGDGYVTCREQTDTANRLCYNPDMGETCCSTQWACPAQSFCLVDPYCCPNGSDPETCARDFGVSLPSSFASSSSPSSSTSTPPVISIPSPIPSPIPSAAATTSPLPETASTTATVSSAIANVPYPYPGGMNTTNGFATGTGSGAPAEFTGAAGRVDGGRGVGGVVVVGGLVGLFGLF
ncbi:hypothetical protein K402DRAFT_451217 [Aulographum hederae CBS 113979]|uniref:Carbohydrate-binding module family 18 protein n=1 Tax=Aulographum hederae CBS 113979 TaxID=1176131 RepID=A0A6G1HAM8_9PEZI|nr:hypothetical protein K402DRAFT_451217 [Aulographum hederae CBS 113979]